MKYQTGATLAEVLIALLIISISSIPIFSILRLSANTYKYSNNNYRANLLLSGLIKETYAFEENWNSANGFDTLFGILIEEFNITYDTDKFDYVLEIKTNEISKVLRTSPLLELETHAIWSGFSETDYFSRRALVTSSIYNKENNFSYTMALPR